MNKAWWMGGMVAAAGVPYCLMDGNVPTWIRATPSQGSATAANATQGTDPAFDAATAASAASATPIVPLDEVFRTDITPEYVKARWPRVVTVVPEMECSGLRVPLISGFQPFDVVGSLTYYFDDQQRICRISFAGQTSDERPLVELLAQRFSLRAEATREGAIFVHRERRQPLSVLLVQHPPMLVTDQPQPNHAIELELNCPRGSLSSAFLARIIQR